MPAFVLDFGVGEGGDAIRALACSVLGLRPVPTPGAARRAAALRAIAEGLLNADQAIFLNDLLDLPQPTDLRLLYDAMDHLVLFPYPAGFFGARLAVLGADRRRGRGRSPSAAGSGGTGWRPQIHPASLSRSRVTFLDTRVPGATFRPLVSRCTTFSPREMTATKTVPRCCSWMALS